jgi:hypothetical protein
MSNASELNDDKLAWVWAYREQLALLDLFDGEGLYCADNGWNVDSWKLFLRTYGLMRGRHAALRDKSTTVLAVLTPLFNAALPATNTTQELTRRWLAGTGEIGKLVARRKDGGNAELLSMASKLLWFYQPKEMTMFDKYAFGAIRKFHGFGQLKAQDFLIAFENVFARENAAITEAAQFSDRKYPYPRRVLDKRLWLQGSGKESEYLQRFRWSLERAPLMAAT